MESMPGSTTVDERDEYDKSGIRANAESCRAQSVVLPGMVRRLRETIGTVREYLFLRNFARRRNEK